MSHKIYLVVIAILLVIILLQKACNQSSPGISVDNNKVIYDTAWNTISKTEYKRIPVFKHDTTYVEGDSVFIADTNCQKLEQQFYNLAKNYKVRKLYIDTVRIDSYGYVLLTDTVQYNTIKSRTYEHQYKIPTITCYVHEKQRFQLYIGGGISVDKTIGLANLQTGILLKNKKSHIFGVQTGISQNLTPFVGVSSYWKIKLK
jgi:hypothetical protein